jgi:hypothetical protein
MFGGELDGSAGAAAEFTGGTEFYDTIASVLGAAIDAQDAHGGSLP